MAVGEASVRGGGEIEGMIMGRVEETWVRVEAMARTWELAEEDNKRVGVVSNGGGGRNGGFTTGGGRL